jgi:hypothetical protein
VLGGAVTHVLITGENLGDAPTVVVLDDPAFPAPASATLLTPSLADPGRAVGVLELPRVTVRRTFRIALRTAEGRTTNALPIDVAPLDRSSRDPVVYRAVTGRIARDGVERTDTLLGLRLTDVLSVRSLTPGLEVVGFTPSADEGQSLAVTLRASPEAELSGDARTSDALTSLSVITNHGTSNRVSYVVEDAAGPSPCSDIPESGAFLTLADPSTGHSFIVAKLGTGDIPAAYNDPVTVVSFVGDRDVGGSITLALESRLADFAENTDATVQFLKYTDLYGSEWLGGSTSTVRVVEASPNRVALCLSEVPIALSRQAASIPAEQFTVSGYLVFTRP